jgi:hypothetical protein
VRVGKLRLRGVTQSLLIGPIGARLEIPNFLVVVVVRLCVSMLAAHLSSTHPVESRAGTDHCLGLDVRVSLDIDLDSLLGGSIGQGKHLAVLALVFIWLTLINTHGRLLLVAGVLSAEIDTLVESVHQTHGVKLGLNALQGGPEERGGLKGELNHEGDGDASGQLGG